VTGRICHSILTADDRPCMQHVCLSHAAHVSVHLIHMHVDNAHEMMLCSSCGVIFAACTKVK